MPVDGDDAINGRINDGFQPHGIFYTVGMVFFIFYNWKRFCLKIENCVAMSNAVVSFEARKPAYKLENLLRA